MKLLPLMGPVVLGAVASKTTDLPIPEFLKLARDWGIVVVLIWIIYYGLTVLFPRLTQQHAATIKELSDGYRAEMKAERDQREGVQSRLVELLEKHLPKE